MKMCLLWVWNKALSTQWEGRCFQLSGQAVDITQSINWHRCVAFIKNYVEVTGT